jgi:eukaryotic-like serine/threonine-protein kinase
MSDIDPVRWRELSSFLDEALELPSAERLAWLETLRAQQPRMAEELQVLLARLETLENSKFLEDDPSFLFKQRSLAGQTLGSYTLETMIGHGGMGSVWLAQRSDGRFEGKAAVKLLNIALMGRGGEERFRREGRVLAKLTHSNIARILDAGVTQSTQPYLVLEYVEGIAIDRYCDDHGLDIEGRLKLFLDVLTAVGHAHANLIVHRDIKPSNILVTREGVVKLLDFGIAKLMEDDTQTDPPTVLTFDGMRALTPDYAAPEQVLSAPITVATDVYSLGVLLYVLLCGQHPTGAGLKSPPQFIRALLEMEPARLSSVAGTPKLKRALRGDLDNIVAKALKKNPSERYSSVKEFADDLRRYLGNEPVLARGDNPWYRIHKFVARNRLQVGLGAVALTAIIATAAIALFEAYQAEAGRDQALTLSSRNEAVADFLSMLISDAASSEKPVTVRDMLERSEALARSSYKDDPEHRAAMFDILGVYYSSNDAHERGESLLREAMNISKGSADRDLRLRLTCDHAFTLATVGKTSAAIQQLQDVVGRPGIPAQRAVSCLDYLGQTYLQSSDPQNGLKYEKLALQRLQEVQHPSPTLESAILAAIGYAEHLNGRNDVADQYYEKSMAQLARTGRDHGTEATTTLDGWGLVSQGAGNPKHALELYDRAVKIFAQNGFDLASQPSVTYNRTRSLELVGRYSDAREGYLQCAAAGEANHTPLPRVYCLLGLASVSQAQGDLAAAERYLATASAIAGAPLSPNYPAAPRMLTLRGILAMKEGHLDDARASFDSVTTISKAAFVTTEALRWRAELNLKEGRLAAAEADARRSMELAQQQQGGLPYSDRTGLGWIVLGEVLAKQGNAAEASKAFHAAVENLSNTVEAGHPMLLQARLLAGAP